MDARRVFEMIHQRSFDRTGGRRPLLFFTYEHLDSRPASPLRAGGRAPRT
jgi:hypothetical protein